MITKCVCGFEGELLNVSHIEDNKSIFKRLVLTDGFVHKILFYPKSLFSLKKHMVRVELFVCPKCSTVKAIDS